jgi:hypothetical protein
MQLKVTKQILNNPRFQKDIKAINESNFRQFNQRISWLLHVSRVVVWIGEAMIDDLVLHLDFLERMGQVRIGKVQ